MKTLVVVELQVPEESSVTLMADTVTERMRGLFEEFSSSLLYSQWNMAVDELAGTYIYVQALCTGEFFSNFMI